MRSFFWLLLLGVALVTLALVVRSGAFARKNPGLPINSAMRQAMDAPQLSEEDAAIVDRRFANAHHLPSGLMYIERAPGTGEHVHAGSRVTVQYDGFLLDGTKFDSSRDRGKPLLFNVGMGEVIKGWDEAFLSMSKGERRTLIVPYWLAYGEESRGPIPARATLVFEVELVDVQ